MRRETFLCARGLCGRALHGFQFGNCLFDFDLLALEMAELLGDLGLRQFQLIHGLRAAIRTEHGAKLRQGKTKGRSPQNLLQAFARGVAIKAGQTGTARLDQAAIFVKPQSPKRDIELPGEVTDGQVIGLVLAAFRLRAATACCAAFDFG